MLDLPMLRRTYIDTCNAIARDLRFGLPAWTASLSETDLLQRPLIFVDTENFAPAFQFLDRNANILAIVNDYKAGTYIGRHQIVTTSAIGGLYKENPNAIFINSTVLQNTQRFFNRNASQIGIPTMSLLQFHRLLRIANKVSIPIRAHGLLEMHDLLGFFDVASQMCDEHCELEKYLDSDFSKITLYCLLMQRLTGETGWHLDVSAGGYMEPYGPDSYIFNSRFFDLSDSETYVDTGAYRGDTVELFANSVKDSFNKVHAFEPDVVNFSYLEAYIAERFGLSQSKVVAHKLGVWDQKTTLKLRSSNGDGRTRIGNHLELKGSDDDDSINASNIGLVKLDDILADEPVSLIKFEVEGAELQAMRGAKRLIETHRPKIALSCYHRARDFIDLLREIKSYDANYRVDLVHHRESLSAGVFYCDPIQ